MARSIRGHSTVITVYQDGTPIVIDSITNFSVQLDSSMSRSFYVGQGTGEGDQTIEGWSGSFDMEVKDGSIETVIDAIVAENINGIDVSEYTMTDTELYRDGTQKTYVYAGLKLSHSKSSGGLTDKVTKSVTFQADARVEV